MRRSKSSAEQPLGREAGSASLEFVTAGLVLLLPLIYLVLVVAAVQAGALAAEASARGAARVFVLHDDADLAGASAERLVRATLADFGIDAEKSEMRVDCVPAACLDPGTLVTVTVQIQVPLPLVPAVLPGDFPLVVDLSAAAVQRVSRFGPG